MRATASTAPPARKGTMMCTVFEGNPWAPAPAAKQSSTIAANPWINPGPLHMVFYIIAVSQTAPFEVEPIGPTLGGEIHGLDLAKPLSPETARRLEEALIERKVIYLRDQNITAAQHVAIGRLFGELEVHPFSPGGEFPEIVVLDNHKDNPVLSTDVWHSDTTFRECPTKYSILRCVIMPKTGGDTLWADMCAVYEGLSESMRRFLEPLQAVHDFKNFRALFTKSEKDQERLRRMEELYPNPTHP